MTLDLYPKPEQEEQAIRQKCRKFIANSLQPQLEQSEKEHRFDKALFLEAGKQGLAAIYYPQSFGGAELPFRCYLAALEELATCSLAFSISLSVSHLSMGCIYKFGTPEQKQKYLPPMARGLMLGAFSLSEPEAGSDAKSLKLSVEPQKDGFVLNGTKSWCTNGKDADVYVVMGREEGRAGSQGIGSFIVEKDTPHLSFGRQEDKMGLWSSSLCQLIFEDTWISQSQRLGKKTEGLKVALSNLDIGRMAIAATSLGLARGALEVCYQHEAQREKEGIPFSTAQKESLALLRAKLQSHKCLLWHTASLFENQESVTMLASQSKLLLSELANEIAQEAISLVGPEATRLGHPLERAFRDAKCLTIVEGTTQVQKLVLSRQPVGAGK